MPGEYIKTKGLNRRFYINVGTTQAPQWEKISLGIRSRGNSISETTTEYFDMESRGVVTTETESIKVQRSFSGCRILGNVAQDFIFNRLYDLNNRNVEYIMFYDNMEPDAINGEQGIASLTISDDGSGDANSLENIAFALNVADKPKRGKVTLNEQTGQPTFTAVPA